jgi:hypothetical protein
VTERDSRFLQVLPSHGMPIGMIKATPAAGAGPREIGTPGASNGAAMPQVQSGSELRRGQVSGRSISTKARRENLADVSDDLPDGGGGPVRLA